MKKGRKPKFKRTTISLPYGLWEELRIESVKKNIPMGKLIAEKLSELKELKKKIAILETDDKGLLKSSD